MDREALARDCVEIESAGGSVRDYLRERGFISPWGTWYRLQKEELHRKEHEITYGRENTMATRVSLEQKKKAVQIALDGGNPFDFLSDCGSKEPAGLWWTIKQNLKKVDPETYAKLPAMLPKKEPVKKAGKKPKDLPIEDDYTLAEKKPEVRPLTKEEHDALKGFEPVCVSEKQEDPQKNPETHKPEAVMEIKAQEIVTDLTEQQQESLRNAPVLPMSFRVVPEEFSITRLKTEIGSFTKSSKTIIWYPEVAQAVQLPADKWKTLVDILPKVIAVMNL